MDLGQFLVDFLNSFVALFREDAAVAVTVVALVVLVFFGSLALAAWRKSELYLANKSRFDLVEREAINFIFLTAFGDVDLTEYEAKADAREAAGLSWIDPRMLFVVDKVEAFANEKLGMNLEFDDILALAERKYRELKHDPASPIGE